MQMKKGILVRLTAMMFIQMMTFPVWFTTLAKFVGERPGWDTPLYSMLMGIGMFASPIVCMFADRFLDSGKVLALCNLVAAAALGGAFYANDSFTLSMLLLVATVALMPTWSLVSAVAMTHASQSSFPYIRALGSVGWAASAIFSIVAIKCFGFSDFEKSPWIFACGAFVAFAGFLTALVQPATPPSAKGSKMSVVDALGLRAFVLLKDRSVFLLSAVVLLSMVAFQWYFYFNSQYLSDAGWNMTTAVINIGTLVELGFMVALPWIIKRLGFKGSTLLGFAALVFRYGAFYLAAKTGCHLLDFGGIMIHGLIFGILIVGIQMHMAEIAPAELRNQAQGFVMLLTAGIGYFLSVGLFRVVLKASEVMPGVIDWTIPFMTAFLIAAAAFILFALFYRNPEKRK